MSRAPIGIFDSGVGGLSVLRHIQEELPHENLLYVADSAHAPYGGKSPHEIQARSLALTEFLIGQGAKAIVVACNTATAADGVPFLYASSAATYGGGEQSLQYFCSARRITCQ